MPGGRFPWPMGDRQGGPLLGPKGGGGSTDFVSQWTTNNPGTSNDDQITLPLDAVGTYNFVVNWGDGSSDDTITTFNDPAVTHTFIGGAGTFTVTITGQLEGWEFNNGGDRQKIIDISNWGSFNFGTTGGGHFFGCTNLDVSATDSPDTSLSANMNSSFRDCSSLTGINVTGFDTSGVTDTSSMFRGDVLLATLDVSGFNTSAVTNMSQMFRDCVSLLVLDLSGFDTALNISFSGFCQGCAGLTALDVSGFDTALVLDLTGAFLNTGVTTLAMDAAGWDIGAATSMISMCQGVTLDTSNYDDILAAWAAQSPVQSAVNCHFGNSQYTIATSQANRDILTDPPNSWLITDGGGL